MPGLRQSPECRKQNARASLLVLLPMPTQLYCPLDYIRGEVEGRKIHPHVQQCGGLHTTAFGGWDTLKRLNLGPHNIHASPEA